MQVKKNNNNIYINMSKLKDIKIVYKNNKDLNVDNKVEINEENIKPLITMLEYARDHESNVYFVFLKHNRLMNKANILTSLKYKQYFKGNYIFYKIKSKKYFNTTDILIFETMSIPKIDLEDFNILSTITIPNIVDYHESLNLHNLNFKTKKSHNRHINTNSKENSDQFLQAKLFLNIIRHNDVKIKKSRILSDSDYLFLSKMFLL